MPATMTFSFFQYTLRPATERDFLLAEDWTRCDPWHRDETDPLFWLDQSPQSESYLLSDHDGPVYFFKMMRTTIDPHIVQIFIQFPPPAETVRKNTRVMLGLVIGLEWLESELISSDVTTVFFKTQSPKLIQFCIGRLGFVPHDKRLNGERLNGEWLMKTISRGTGNGRSIVRPGEAASGADGLLQDGNR